MQALRKMFTKRPQTTEELTAAHEAIRQELEQSQALLDTLLDSRPASALAALVDGESGNLSKELAEARTRVADLTAALIAIQRQQETAAKADSAAIEQKRRDRLAELLKRREEAAQTLTDTLRKVADLVEEIGQAEAAVQAIHPVGLGPSGWGVGIVGLVQTSLAASSPRFSHFLPGLTSAHALRNGPSLVDIVKNGNAQIMGEG